MLNIARPEFSLVAVYGGALGGVIIWRPRGGFCLIREGPAFLEITG